MNSNTKQSDFCITKHMLGRKVLLCVLSFLFVGVFVSCSKVNDIRLTALEKSIERLEQNYKDYSPEKLQKEINLCEKQFDALYQKEDSLSDAQQKRLANVKGKYHRVLLEIKLWSLTQTITEEGAEAIEYIKGLLGGD